MKKLYVIRHAKSSWENILLSDFDRPLNDRGKRDAPRMAARLNEQGVMPDLMLSSPANRALTTCREIAVGLHFPAEKIKTDRNLYHADEDEILNVVKHLPDNHTVVMLFGHNPGLTDFVNSLADADIDNVPTCGVVAIALNVEPWNDVTWESGTVEFFDYPKRKK